MKRTLPSRHALSVHRWITLLLALGLTGTASAAIVTFDDLSLPAESYWNGADGSGLFRSGGAYFPNDYDATWDSWMGFAYSNLTDTQSTGLESQYNAIAGSGQNHSKVYGVSFVGWEEPPAMTLSTPQALTGLYVTNNNYTYYSMRDGSLFSKQFGGATGDEEDWFKLTVTGRDTAGAVTGEVEFFLADFRFADSEQDYIIDTWQYIDLTPLGVVETLEFALDSSDTGAFGMNTPGYFCLDTIVPEPTTVLLLGLGGLFARRGRQ